MKYRDCEYIAIKQLLEKYGIIFKEAVDYDRYIRDLARILKV